MKYFAGMLAIVAVVAAGTAIGYHFWDNATSSGSDNGGVLAGSQSTLPPGTPAPPEGSVFVTGTIAAAHIESAVLSPLAMPLSITTPQRGEGSGATVSGVQVNGDTASIEWDAGRPLELSGDGGALLLAPVVVDVAGGKATVTLDGQPHGFNPGTYKINTPVAVATGDNLGEPADRVTFAATPDSHVAFRGGATTPLPDGAVQMSGQGRVSLEGAPNVVRPDRTVTATAGLTLDNGSYQITLTPDGNGGYAVQATLNGPVR